PFITPEIIDRSILESRKTGAAVVGMPVKDTIKQVASNGVVDKTLNRSRLWLVQTPQTFRVPLIMKAHRIARQESLVATDDSSLVEHMGRDVLMVEGSYGNIKITTPEDIIIGEELLRKREVEKT
ncbi:MAG TPA: 2-C-methyl-D-erythritol 4-phosphate cytidylyltransferase, partial [Clostridia bacterium]|nr:2-C-methyl-D-erythritol 4-phosphate cytidylyltransferase [Clostridia bacterium]